MKASYRDHLFVEEHGRYYQLKVLLPCLRYWLGGKRADRKDRGRDRRYVGTLSQQHQALAAARALSPAAIRAKTLVEMVFANYAISVKS